MEAKEFAQKFLLNEVKRMEAANVQLHLLLAIINGIETAGALLDPLPYKAKGQGKKRFDLALRRLFPVSYSNAGKELNLYSQLRSHLVHCMLPSKYVHITSSAASHLNYSEKVLYISLPVLFKDYCCAMDELISLIESGKLKNKKIFFDNLEGFVND